MEDIWFQSTYKTGKNRRVFVGYPTIDKTLGGLGGKDIMAILGRMKQGKTYYLSAMAMNAVLNGNKVLYINYEMSNQEITERILAMMTRIQEKSYRNRLMSTEELDYLKFFIENFAREYKSKFMFIGSNDTVKPKDLLRYCGSYGPDLTCLDSPYMMAKDGKQEVHAQVRNTMVQLKEVNSQLAIPSIMTFQLNREYKDKENGKEIKKATTYDIAESDFIARVASSLFTIRKDEHNDKIKHLDLIAGRGSGEVSMACNFDFVNYDFSEISAKGTMGVNFDDYHMEGMF
jgi:replicative DNA helicase